MESEVVLETNTDTKDQYMEEKHKEAIKPKEFITGNSFLDKITYNDQGSSHWYKAQFPGFPDEYYHIFELYSLGGIRFKEYRNLLKKLDKKGKLQRPDGDSVIEAFSKMNFNDSEDEMEVLISDNTSK